MTAPSASAAGRRGLLILVPSLLGALVAAVLVFRGATHGVPVWAAGVGGAAALCWTIRALVADRAPRAVTDVALMAMLALGALAGVPTDATGSIPALAGIAIMVGQARFEPRTRFTMIGATALLALVGALIGPATGWSIAGVGLELVVAVLVGLGRRQREREAAAARAELERVHAEELAAARTGEFSADALRGRFPQLSPREADVLALMARGRSNAEIAADLFVSVATVKSHVNAVFAKLPARDRGHAIAVALGVSAPGRDT